MNTFYTNKVYILYQNDYEKDRIINYIKKFNIILDYKLFKSIDYDNTINLKEEHISANLYFNKYIKLYNNYKINKNQISHSSSIIKILKDAVNSNYSSITILEYDIYFNNNLNKLLPKYKSLIDNSDIIYLGTSQHRWYNPINNTKILYYNNYYEANHSLGTFAIILKK